MEFFFQQQVATLIGLGQFLALLPGAVSHEKGYLRIKFKEIFEV